METGAEAGGGGMTCINGKYENGKPTCTKGYPVQLMKCLKGGLPCYQDKGGDTNGMPNRKAKKNYR